MFTCSQEACSIYNKYFRCAWSGEHLFLMFDLEQTFIQSCSSHILFHEDLILLAKKSKTASSNVLFELQQ